MSDEGRFQGFQAGCKHRLARRKLPSRETLQDKWGYSVLEAESFEGGYEITRDVQDSIKGGAAAVKANQWTLKRMTDGIAKAKQREQLVSLIKSRSETFKSNVIAA